MRPEGDTWGPFSFAGIRGEKYNGVNKIKLIAAGSFARESPRNPE